MKTLRLFFILTILCYLTIILTPVCALSQYRIERIAVNNDMQGPVTSANFVAVYGNHAYTVSSEMGLWVLDVSDPYSPVTIGRYQYPDAAPYYVAIVGDRAYLTDAGQHGLMILDISSPDPAHPDDWIHLLGSYIYNGAGASAVYASVNNAFVRFSRPAELLVSLDVTDPTNIQLMDSVYFENGSADVAVIDSTWFSADGWGGRGIVATDISNPYDLHILGWYEDTKARHPIGITVENSYAYVTHASGEMPAVEKINVADPSQMHQVALFELPPGYPATDLDFFDAAYNGMSLGRYIAVNVIEDQATPKGQQLILLDPADLVPVPEIAPYLGVGEPVTLVTSGDYIYVADRMEGLEVFKITRTNNPPIANAGDDETVHVGVEVTLDGSGSYDPDLDYPLSYAWKCVGEPTGTLSGADTATPSFVPNLVGDYTVELVVTDSQGAESQPDTVVISTENSAPIADAGEDRAVIVIGTLVQLDGTQSWDPDGDSITHLWTMTAQPPDSTASLDDDTSPTPSFVPDVYGGYGITLTVSDSWTSSTDTVAVSFDNIAPVADAGNIQSVFVGETVYLDGSGSSDANGDPLTYSWNIVTKPTDSEAELTDPHSVEPSFLADLSGEYIVSLVVNDGLVDSVPSNVSILAISYQDTITDILQQLIDAINGLGDNVFKNKNMRNALTNKINAAIEQVSQGLYQEALDKLQNDILGKTNGCGEIGSPDKNDWIRDCDAQGQVYPLIIEAIELLENLI